MKQSKRRKRERKRNALLVSDAQAAADAVAERERNADREAVERAARVLGWPKLRRANQRARHAREE